jgi:hypothetical protein
MAATPGCRVVCSTRSETTARPRYAGEPDGRNLRVRLIDASNGNIDPLADISPIRTLLDQGCEADVVPIVAREVPDLPMPLRTGSSGAGWGKP